jgi:hypothetical protein
MRLYSGLMAAVAALAVTPGLLVSAGCGGGENDCIECQQEKCTDLVAVCDPDPDCACMADCVAKRGIPGVRSCLGDCGLSERPDAFYLLEECMATACPDSDECSTPSGYSPPERNVPPGSTTAPGLGGGELEDCSFDPELTFDPEGSVLQLQSADGIVSSAATTAVAAWRTPSGRCLTCAWDRSARSHTSMIRPPSATTRATTTSWTGPTPGPAARIMI